MLSLQLATNFPVVEGREGNQRVRLLGKLWCVMRNILHTEKNNQVVLGRLWQTAGSREELHKNCTFLLRSIIWGIKAETPGTLELLEIKTVKVAFYPGCSPQPKPLQQAGLTRGFTCCQHPCSLCCCTFLCTNTHPSNKPGSHPHLPRSSRASQHSRRLSTSEGALKMLLKC